MPNYIDRDGDEIWLASSSPYDGLMTAGVFAVLIPISIIVCPAFLLADFIAENFYISTTVFFIVSALAALIMARIKYKKVNGVLIDAFGNFAMLASYYLITYLYFVPNVRITSNGVLLWLVFVLIVSVIVFIRQCVRKIIDSAIANCILGIVVLLLTYAAFCVAVSVSLFNENYVLKAYEISGNSFFADIVGMLFYIPSKF